MAKLDNLHLSGIITFSIPVTPGIGDVWLECRKKKLLNGKHQWVAHPHVYDGSDWVWLRAYGELSDFVFAVKEQYLHKRNLLKKQLCDRRGLRVVRYEQMICGKLQDGFAFLRQVPYLPLTCRLIGDISEGSAVG